MRTVSDHITGTSPIMIAFIVGSSVLTIVGIGYLLYQEISNGFEWNTMTRDFKILLGVFIFILVFMGGLCWMMLNLSITIKGDKDLIRAKIFPFMRSYREIPLAEVVRMEVIDFSGGVSKYGGVGYKNNFGRRTSYTLHLGGHALALYIKGKKELHVEISKVEEWKNYVEAFQNQSL